MHPVKQRIKKIFHFRIDSQYRNKGNEWMPVRKIRSYILRAMGLTSGVTSFFSWGWGTGRIGVGLVKSIRSPPPPSLFNEVKVNTYHFRQNWVEYTKIQKKLFFFQYTEKWSTIKVSTRDFVSSAARRWMVRAIHFPTSQSAPAKNTIYLCGT